MNITTTNPTLLQFLRAKGVTKFYADKRKNIWRIKIVRSQNVLNENDFNEIKSFNPLIIEVIVEKREIPGFNFSKNFVIIRTTKQPSLIYKK